MYNYIFSCKVYKYFVRLCERGCLKRSNLVILNVVKGLHLSVVLILRCAQNDKKQ